MGTTPKPAGNAKGGNWLDPVWAARDRLLANPRFQRWASSFPLTRPIARRRARAVFDLCAGFVYSQILLAAVQLRLFELLEKGPKTLDDIATETGLSPDRARRLLEGAAALGLIETRGTGRYGLGPHGAALLANPGLARMIEHHAIFYRDLADPVALLKGEIPETGLSRYWAYAKSSASSTLEQADVKSYTDLMAASQTLVADEILDAYPLGNHKRLLDIGGGNGTFLSRAAERAPHLDLMLFDLPAVAGEASRNLAALTSQGRTKITGGDFRRDALPEGADLATLIRIIHDHDDDTVHTILAAAKRALAPQNGTLLIAEPMSATPGAKPVGEAYFGFYLMAMGSGRPRTAAEIRNFLERAGFARIRMIPTRIPLQSSIVVAEA